MKYLAVICLLFTAPAVLLAQSQEEIDKGYLTELIEDNLSGVSREVTITGFAGALSSRATIETLTVADGAGIWLTLEDIVLDWNRAALLRGQIDVNDISATRVILSRPPVSEQAGPTPEATPFALPELPVGISLDRLNIGRIELSDDFLGEPIAFGVVGSAELSGGEGVANFVATRLGEKTGVFEIDGQFSNATEILGLKMNIEEGADGIAARFLDLPGRPSVKLAIDGTAPISDYAATLAIATNGQDRISGTFGMTTTDAGRSVRLNVGGDVTPLLLPEYQAFFGDDVLLVAEGRQLADGRFDLSAFDITTQSLAFSGAARIGAQGWPERFNLVGSIAPMQGTALLLPMAGPRTFISGGSLNISFDTTVSPDWAADIQIAGFDRPGLRIADVSLQGGGILRPGEGPDVGEVTANLQYGARGVQLDDAGVADAFGDTISGVFEASRTEGFPVEISQLTLSGPGLEAFAEATIAGPGSGLRTQSTLIFTVEALDRFSTLTGRALGGAAKLTVLSTITPLDGLFDFIVIGQAAGLAIDIPQVDALMRGAGILAASAVRDTQGVRLEALTVKTDAVRLTGSADLTSAGGSARFDAALSDIGLVLDTLNGPATLAGTADRAADGVVSFDLTGTGTSTALTAAGTILDADAGRVISAAIDADVSDLSQYASVANRPLAGSAEVSLKGTLQTDGLLFDATLDAKTRDLVTGFVQIDPLLGGPGTVTAAMSRSAGDTYVVSNLDVSSAVMSLRGTGDYRPDGPAKADLAFRIPDVGALDPSASGPLDLIANAVRGPEGVAQVSVVADGPGVALQADAAIASPALGYEITGDMTADVANLRPYRALVGRPVSGGVKATISASGLPDLTRFDGTAAVRTENLEIGYATVDLLLRGTGRLNLAAALEKNRLTVSTLEATTPQAVLVGALNGNAGSGQGRFNATLRDIGIFTDQINGAIRTSGTATLDANGNWGIDATGTGPGGITGQVTGNVAANLQDILPTLQLDLGVRGTAPLALANASIEPRRLSGMANLDLRVVGPPALSSLNGNVSFSGGRLAAPTLSQALSDISGTAALNNGTAQLNVQADVEAGGNLHITGPVALNTPNNGDLSIGLRDVVVRDPDLYRTSMSGDLVMKGPMSGGAGIAGTLELGQTDIQVPSSVISALGDLPDVTHVGETIVVQRTLERAGVRTAASEAQAGPPRAPFPLSIRINAPSRIFVRGRGLDAELGGALRLGGTTDQVIPSGQFELVRGRIDILQQRFQLTEGSASLQGDFEPYIRLVATTEAATGTTINIIIEGPATAPEVRFESIPDLPQDEVLSQLIFGRDLDSISPLQAVQLASAISTLAGRGGGALNLLRRTVGLDDFDVTANEEGTASVRAGKYVTDNIYTDVTVTSEGETEINLNLDITDQVTAKGSVDDVGETSVGIFFQRDY